MRSFAPANIAMKACVRIEYRFLQILPIVTEPDLRVVYQSFKELFQILSVAIVVPFTDWSG